MRIMALYFCAYRFSRNSNTLAEARGTRKVEHHHVPTPSLHSCLGHPLPSPVATRRRTKRVKRAQKAQLKKLEGPTPQEFQKPAETGSGLDRPWDRPWVQPWVQPWDWTWGSAYSNYNSGTRRILKSQPRPPLIAPMDKIRRSGDPRYD